MNWNLARERLGAELIGARETVAARFRLALRDRGAVLWSLESCAAELVLHAGAALADGAPGETPWQRCGGLLRIEARDRGRALHLELSVLWSCMAGTLAQRCLNLDEERQAREALGQQLEAVLRGAAAEVEAALLDGAVHGPLRFGGVRTLCWTAPEERAGVRAA